MNTNDRPITVIFGPTASGKTDLAVALARRWKNELKQPVTIVSFDSRQVYQGMAIVTGQDQPDPNWPVQGYGLLPPNEKWSVAEWLKWVARMSAEWQQCEGRIIFVGGTWPYAAALWNPPASIGVPVDANARQTWNQWLLPALQNELMQRDPQRWQNMNQSDRQNSRRLIRALEIAKFVSSGQDWPVAQAIFLASQIKVVVIEPELATLTERIRQRVAQRWQAGALAETSQLTARFDDWSGPAFSATGYTFLRQHLDGKLSQDQAMQLWTQQERAYAKKQLTWVRKLKKMAQNQQVDADRDTMPLIEFVPLMEYSQYP